MGFNDDEPTDNEIFQLEPSGNGTWIIKVNNSPDPNPTIWETMADGSIHCTGAATPAAEAEPQCLFEVEFLGTQIAIKSVSNGKYVSQAMNKYLKAKADPSTTSASLSSRSSTARSWCSGARTAS